MSDFCDEQVCKVCGKRLALGDDKCWECLEDEERFEISKTLTDGFFEYRLDIADDCPLDTDAAIERINEVMEDAWADVEEEIIRIEDEASLYVEETLLDMLVHNKDEWADLPTLITEHTPSTALMIWEDSYQLDDVYNYTLYDIVAAAQLDPPNCLYWGATRTQNCLDRVGRERTVQFLAELVEKQEED